MTKETQRVIDFLKRNSAIVDEARTQKSDFSLALANVVGKHGHQYSFSSLDRVDWKEVAETVNEN
jgi:hypothetical protein